MKSRVQNRPLPQISVVDMRAEKELRKLAGADRPFWMSAALYTALNETYAKHEQSALFLNRRGVAQSVFCEACGYTPECPNCAVSLTLHGKNHLLCHYCDYHELLVSPCTDCHQGEPKAMGLGTELIERDLVKLFPSASIIRMDRDEIESREDLEGAIREIEARKVDIIVGTQMIAKGLDFPGLTLVGLVLADIAFNLPDFRASERSFQLLTQVSGRSGRHVQDQPGKVIVQTYNPEHPSIQFTQDHLYESFAEHELGFRGPLHYPPFWKLAAVRFLGPHEPETKSVATEFRRRSQLLLQQEAYSSIEVLGPAPAPIARIRNKYRFHLLLKAPNSHLLGQFCRHVLGRSDWISSHVKVSIDIDAMQLL